MLFRTRFEKCCFKVIFFYRRGQLSLGIFQDHRGFVPLHSNHTEDLFTLSRIQIQFYLLWLLEHRDQLVQNKTVPLVKLTLREIFRDHEAGIPKVFWGSPISTLAACIIRQFTVWYRILTCIDVRLNYTLCKLCHSFFPNQERYFFIYYIPKHTPGVWGLFPYPTNKWSSCKIEQFENLSSCIIYQIRT